MHTMLIMVMTVACLALVSFDAPASAQGTPDGMPPAVEDVCDGQTGAAYGLCVAYCEAMDCDSPLVHASEKACRAVKRNWQKMTGATDLPCETVCIEDRFCDTDAGETADNCPNDCGV